jgi:hypothetical protein
MATKHIDILRSGAGPDSSGNCWQEPYRRLATNDVWGDLYLWMFGGTISNNTAPTTRIGLTGQFVVPADFVGTAVLEIRWTTTLTSGDVVWDCDYRAVGGNDAESLDQASNQESVTVTDTAPGAANRLLVTTISLTSANFAAGDTVEFTIFRDGTDSADTLAGTAILVGARFQYADV